MIMIIILCFCLIAIILYYFNCKCKDHGLDKVSTVVGMEIPTKKQKKCLFKRLTKKK